MSEGVDYNEFDAKAYKKDHTWDMEKRNFVFTCNNYTQEDIEALRNLNKVRVMVFWLYFYFTYRF